MLRLLVWLSGTVLLGYVIVHDHLWKIGLAALTDLAFILWVIGGSAALAGQRGQRGTGSVAEKEWAKHIRSMAAQEEAARKEGANVGK